jgi:nitrogen fixation/metabolism regulation signal transduction histidine kinase
MRFTLSKKLLVLLFFVIVLPLVIFSYLAVTDAKKIGEIAIKNARQMSNDSLNDSTNALNNLGIMVIKQRAQDIAKMLDTYINAYPTKTIAQLQSDPAFAALAVQSVGLKGYSAVHNSATFTNYFHSNPKIINTNLMDLKTKLPAFVALLEKTAGGQEFGDYYDWAEADGSIAQKYMHVAQGAAKTADGVQLSVAATTYISDFNQPIVQIKEKNEKILNETNSSTIAATQMMFNKNVLLLLIILILVSIIGYVYAQSIARPIRELKNAADKITLGNFDTVLPSGNGSDEVADLVVSMEMLITALKHKMQSNK